MATFTKEQIEQLSQWERNFHTAVHADWASNPGLTALSVIHRIYCGATGDRRRLNDNCQHCILDLLRDCGRIYFKDKAEFEAQKAVSTQEAGDIPIKKVKVVTTARKSASSAKKSAPNAKK